MPLRPKSTHSGWVNYFCNSRVKFECNSTLQYIVTMNSDIFDRLPLSETIDRDDVVLETRLSDDTESGGLFGFRFD